MDKKTIQPEKIVIKEFRLIKGQLDSPYDFRISGIKSFDFNVNLAIGVNIDENLIKSDFDLTVATVSDAETTEANASYQITFLFLVDNLNEHAQTQDDGFVDWNPYLANAIASITYSTARGILWSRFQGTVMENFILPVIDPNELLRKNSQP